MNRWYLWRTLFFPRHWSQIPPVSHPLLLSTKGINDTEERWRNKAVWGRPLLSAVWSEHWRMMEECARDGGHAIKAWWMHSILPFRSRLPVRFSAGFFSQFYFYAQRRVWRMRVQYCRYRWSVSIKPQTIQSELPVDSTQATDSPIQTCFKITGFKLFSTP